MNQMTYVAPTDQTWASYQMSIIAPYNLMNSTDLFMYSEYFTYAVEFTTKSFNSDTQMTNPVYKF